MKYHDSLAESQVKKDLALALLDEHELAYNPVNYAVAYQYVAKTNDALITAFDRAKEQGRIDQLLIEQLFERHVEPQQEQDNSEFYNLESTINNLQEASAGSSQAVGYLDQQLTDAASTSPKEVANALRNAQQAAKQIQAQQQQLEAFVAQAQAQTNAMKTELEQAKQRAITDPLTNLLNREGLNNIFVDYTEQQKKQHITAIVVDIDHFKRFNDEFGHLIGDVILRRLAKLLKESVANIGHAFRFGGEEFVLLIPDQEVKASQNIAEDIRQKVERLRFVSAKTKQRLPKLTISMGLSAWRDAEHIDSLLSRADDALYQAKNDGRNQVKLG